MATRPRRSFFFHPILFGVYPILALLANNLEQARPSAALRAGLVSLAACVLFYAGLRLITRSAGRAAVLASLWLILFYTYGHAYQLAEGWTLLGIVIGKHRYLVSLWVVLGSAGSWWILKKLRDSQGLNQVLNLVSALLVAFPLVQTGLFEYRYRHPLAAPPAAAVSTTASTIGIETPGPDIYYIILDGYSRADVMQKLYQLDIGPFMDELKSIGFAFPECAQSNYGMTAFSMFASLNMDYLEAYPSVFPLGSDADKVDNITMHDFLRHSQARQFLARRGYRMVTFETGYWWLDIDDADMYVVGNDNPLIRYNQNYAVSSFEDMFLRTTALRVLAEMRTALTSRVSPRIRTPNQRHYEITRFELDQLEQVSQIPGKKFVYLHLAAPHSPFVFDAQGNFVDYDPRAGNVPGYPDEVTYLNKRVVQLVRSLIARSAQPPIIVIQGDHGWDPRYRMPILNAYYLPGGGARRLYPTITPVNTFRLIFDQYFGGHFGFIRDASYFSIGDDFPQYGILSRPYQMTPVPGSCMGELK